MFVKHAGCELAQLIEQDVIFLGDMVRIARHHEKQEGVTLDMAKEAKSKSFSFRCALDDSRDIGHDEGFSVTTGHDAERGFHGREGIVGNLRTG